MFRNVWANSSRVFINCVCTSCVPKGGGSIKTYALFISSKCLMGTRRNIIVFLRYKNCSLIAYDETSCVVNATLLYASAGELIHYSN